MPDIESKTAFLRPTPPCKYFLHIIESADRTGWMVIHSILPLRNGGGQIVTMNVEKDEAERIAWRICVGAYDQILVHEDVLIGGYNPKTNSNLYARPLSVV
jgi:hypothetical protein